MQVGSLVECINDTFSELEFENLPVRGQIYTVREVLDKHKSIRLEEIINVPRYYTLGYMECAFLQHRFRELQSPDEVNIEELIAEYA